MKTPSPLPSREFGLALGFILGRYCLNMQDLHYGFWSESLPVSLLNLPKAQELYTQFLISHIPAGVETILDVGCGAGNTARKLLEREYRVDCVSPNSLLMDIAREVLAEKATLFECRFEDLQTDKRYDLLLFSESLLFMPVKLALEKSLDLLNQGGYLLICDVFSISPEGQSPIGGGHQLSAFKEAIECYPFQQLKDLDITSHIAPTFTVLNDAYAKAIKPAYDLLVAQMSGHHPWLMRFLRWKFRRKLEQSERKHFSGKRTAENFGRFKSYHLFLYRNCKAVS